MAKHLFVSFDPLSTMVGARQTNFAPLGRASLALADADKRERDEEASFAPLYPETHEELQAFAAIMGWKTSYDANGRIVFHPELSPDFDGNE